jgi:hypothetical protein
MMSMKTMKISVLLTCALLLDAANVANAAFTMDFEEKDVAGEGWAYVNENQQGTPWTRGTDVSCGGRYSLYASAGLFYYIPGYYPANGMHFYRAIGDGAGTLSFDAVGLGIAGKDFMRVYVASSEPRAGSLPNGTSYGPAICGYSTCTRITINIPAGADGRYLIFTWKTTSSGTDSQQPVAIDNITYTGNEPKLKITGATIAAKTYDGTNTATVTKVNFNSGLKSVSLALGTDYTATATFDAATAGSGKTVTVKVKLKSAAATNYTLSSSTYTLTGQSIAQKSISIDSVFASLENYSATGSATVDSVWFEGLLAGDKLASNTDYTVDSAVISGCIRTGYGKEIKLYISLVDDGLTAKNYALEASSSPYILYDPSALKSAKRVIFVVGMNSWPLSDVLAYLLNDELKRDGSYEDVTRNSAVQRQVKALRRCEIAKNSDCLSVCNLLKWSVAQGVAQVCLVKAQGDEKGGYTFSAEFLGEQGLRTASCIAAGTSAVQLKKAAWELAGLLRKSASTPEVCCEP